MLSYLTHIYWGAALVKPLEVKPTLAKPSQKGGVRGQMGVTGYYWEGDNIEGKVNQLALQRSRAASAVRSRELLH